MSGRTPAEVNPEALGWPRETLGMPVEVAAKRIGVTPDRLERFEQGIAKPTVNQLRKIAKTYRRPTAYFYLSQRPEEPERINDFRALPELHTPDLPDLLDAVSAAREKRKVAIDLANLLDEVIPEFGVQATLTESPILVAQRIRERLGVDLVEQKQWRDKYVVLKNWCTTIESAGVLTTQFSRVQLEAARGFSISTGPYPLIAINGKDSPRAKVFTVFHELAHIALHQSGLCDLHGDDSALQQIEPFCNRVAAEALVPTADFESEELVTSHSLEEWEEWELRRLGTTYGVSQEVVLRKLLTMNRTSQSFYESWRSERQQLDIERRQSSSGFLMHFRRVLRDNGVALTSLILNAYRADRLTGAEVSRYLGGVNLKHLSSIEAALPSRKN